MPSNKLCLKVLYVGQLIKKWNSSSICSGQKGHFRSGAGIPWCLPVSISKVWLDSLNLDIAILSDVFCTSNSIRSLYCNVCQ